jgi:hypothetical protein
MTVCGRSAPPLLAHVGVTNPISLNSGPPEKGRIVTPAEIAHKPRLMERLEKDS